MHDYDSDDDLDCIYKITTQEQDWENLIANGYISWEREISCASNSDEEVERWQNQLDEVTTLNYNMMTRLLHCVATEVRDLPTYDGLSEVDDFLNKVKREVPKQQHFNALKWVLRDTPARWWDTHQRSFED